MNATFAERVKACRTELGISQQELADRIGVRRATLCNWEKGHNKPHEKTITKLAEVFVVFPQWLASGTGPKNKTEQEKLAEERRTMKHQKEKEAIAAKKAAEAAGSAQPAPTPRCSYVKSELTRDEKILAILNRTIQTIGNAKIPEARKMHHILARMRNETEELIYFGPAAGSDRSTDSAAIADINQLIGIIADIELQTSQKEDLYLYLNEKRSDYEMRLLFS